PRDVAVRDGDHFLDERRRMRRKEVVDGAARERRGPRRIGRTAALALRGRNRRDDEGAECGYETNELASCLCHAREYAPRTGRSPARNASGVNCCAIKWLRDHFRTVARTAASICAAASASIVSSRSSPGLLIRCTHTWVPSSRRISWTSSDSWSDRV